MTSVVRVLLKISSKGLLIACQLRFSTGFCLTLTALRAVFNACLVAFFCSGRAAAEGN